MPLPGLGRYLASGAVFDADRIYRYRLYRKWGICEETECAIALWIMLNPSTADEHVLDPTLRRVEQFSRAQGFDGFQVANLFAYRATDPDTLWKESLCGMDVVGEDNDDHIIQMVLLADRIIIGWGNHRMANDRVRRVLSFLKPRPLWCLGTNKDGSPRHPLYLRQTTALVPFQGLD